MFKDTQGSSYILPSCQQWNRHLFGFKKEIMGVQGRLEISGLVMKARRNGRRQGLAGCVMWSQTRYRMKLNAQTSDVPSCMLLEGSISPCGRLPCLAATVLEKRLASSRILGAY